MTKIIVHESDKEVYGWPIYDSVSNQPIIVQDVTAATFVLKFGTLVITLTLGSGIEAAVTNGVLTVTATVPVSETEKLSDAGVVLDGEYQMRVTRGTIGPETIGEGVAEGRLKAEGG